MAIIPTSGEFVKVPDGGGALFCTVTNSTLNKTMGEIQTAIQAGMTVFFVENGNYMSVGAVHFVRPDMVSGGYVGSIDTVDRLSYKVSEETEAAALAAYPQTDK